MMRLLWLYAYSRKSDRPADLGYYIGYKIAEAYYKESDDKNTAIADLLNEKKYEKIFKQSGYSQLACQR